MEQKEQGKFICLVFRWRVGAKRATLMHFTKEATKLFTCTKIIGFD